MSPLSLCNPFFPPIQYIMHVSAVCIDYMANIDPLCTIMFIFIAILIVLCQTHTIYHGLTTPGGEHQYKSDH